VAKHLFHYFSFGSQQPRVRQVPSRYLKIAGGGDSGDESVCLLGFVCLLGVLVLWYLPHSEHL
jgi:hypothetical protein